VASAVIGEPDPQLRAAIVLQDSPHGTNATLSLSRSNQRLGQRQLVAASCDEALDAVVAVVALALSSAPSTLEPPSSPRPEPRRLTEATPAAFARELAPLVDRGTSRYEETGAGQRALLLSTGADLSGGAALLSVGAELRTEAGAWRAQLRYGLPSTRDEEEAEPLHSLRARSERAAAALDYCHDAGTAHWLALCAGLELGAVRHWQAESVDGEARRERRWLAPYLAAALGSRLSYRGWRWQPGMELSMALPVLDAGEGRRVGLRAQAGVAVPF
jgi:hypothetical protein